MRTINIGRSPENEIVLSDSTVSRNHASLIIDGSLFWINDLGSGIRFCINGNRIYGEKPLGRHDILKVGIVFSSLVLLIII
jgi:pSer/pThr/pTyr-binding forkhead associated (FHA) protein